MDAKEKSQSPEKRRTRKTSSQWVLTATCKEKQNKKQIKLIIIIIIIIEILIRHTLCI